MKTNDNPWGCDHVVQRLEAMVDGELSAVDQTRVDAHLAVCDACASAVLHAAAIKRSMNELPQLRCPERVIVAAEREQLNDLTATGGSVSRWAVVAIALAASLALVWLVPTDRPNETTTIATTEAQRAERALVELQDTLQTQATSVGRKTFEHGVAKPTRIVMAAVSESQLGRWSAKAVSLFAAPDSAPSDAT